MDTNKSISEVFNNNASVADELAKLKRISEIDNSINLKFDDLVISSASEEHVKELAELWANLASIQQLSLPERYNFKKEGKDWQIFVRNKINKKNNLLLVAHRQNEYEVRGFLYLQTITIPSSDLVLKGVIEDIYIKPQHRRLGIAFKLLNIALEWSLSQNIKQVDFISLSNAKDLSGFYINFLKKLKKDVNLELITF